MLIEKAADVVLPLCLKTFWTCRFTQSCCHDRVCSMWFLPHSPCCCLFPVFLAVPSCCQHVLLSWGYPCDLRRSHSPRWRLAVWWRVILQLGQILLLIRSCCLLTINLLLALIILIHPVLRPGFPLSTNPCQLLSPEKLFQLFPIQTFRQ